jgi:hypothetical protein
MPAFGWFYWKKPLLYNIFCSMSNISLVASCSFLIDGLIRLVKTVQHLDDQSFLDKKFVTYHILSYALVIALTMYQNIDGMFLHKSSDWKKFERTAITYMSVYFVSELILVVILNRIVN